MPDFLLSDSEICQSCPAIGMRTIELDGYNADALRCHTDTCEMHSQLKMVSTAQAKKLRDWLFESCTEHAGVSYDCEYCDEGDFWYFPHRYDCPDCMKQLEDMK